MKKQLLSTSAIALGVAAAAPASAQDWNLDWGGFMNTHIAIADVSDNGIDSAGNPTVTDFDGVNHFTTGEIIFSPNVTLDNGLTFGVNVQFEAQANDTNIDESYVSISGDSFGRLVLGNENSAGYLLMVGAPGVTSAFINSPSISAFIPLSNGLPGAADAAGGNTNAFAFRQAGISSYTEVAGNNDVPRISYFTPNFNGFQLGVSYARNNAGNASSSANNSNGATVEDIFDIGASYSQTLGTVDLSLAARWGTGSAVQTGISDPDTWGVGAQVGFNGFTIGGSYAENDNADLNNDGAFQGAESDQQGWSLGVTYDAAGPWSFEALTYQGDFESDDDSLDGEYQAYRIGASRDLGPGVDWDIYAVYAETEDSVSGANVDGTVIGTAINLSF